MDTLIPPERVLLHSKANSKAAIISELAALLPTIDLDLAVEVVMARERLGSTGIGHGVAIPHGRIAHLGQPIVALARHRRGIDFDAIDGKPVHIVVLLLAPEDADRSHLELLAHLARILQNEQVRRSIMQAESAEAVSALFPSMDRSSA